MPDLLNKQAIVNLLIDSPLREPIKINLIDIVNNTNEPDLPKVYSTITKELEIFQKATERRMKLADETIAKLGGNTTPSAPTTPDFSAPAPTPTPIQQEVPITNEVPVVAPAEVPVEAPKAELTAAQLDLPPVPQMPSLQPTSSPAPVTDMLPIPPMPAATPAQPPAMPDFQPLGATPTSSTSDEDALAEIQKELDSLKNEAAADLAATAAPANPPTQQ